MAMKAYESYKDTEYDWLPRIPTHWTRHSVREITSVSSERNENAFSRNDLLSVYREYGVIKKFSRDDNHNVESLDLSKYKTVHKNYLVINKMKMWQGSLGISKYDGIVSPAYIVCKLNLANVNYQFIHALLRAATFKTFYNRISYGVRVGQWDASYEDLKPLNLYLPPKKEQDQIVRYLDWQNSRLNKLINAKKKEIALLEEQKQALISQAVTKGLDPHAPLKDSGIDWIGQIPEHWEKSRLKECTIFLPSFAHNNISLDTVVTFTPMECIKSGHFVPGTAKLADMKQYTYYGEGDVVIAKVSPCFENGNIAIMRGLSSGIGFGSSELFVYRPIHINTDFLFFWLQNHNFKQKAQSTMTGTGGLKRVSASFMKDSPIYIPPIDEQKYISNYLYNRCVLIDNLIVNINKTISLLQEYRTRLVADVVTGQIDVRNIAIPNYETVTETIDQPETNEDENNTTEK
mgnify:CR=1 FL=1